MTFKRFLLPLLLLLPIAAGAQQVPVITDSRIKTLVYNENDVYSLLTHYGYQANIEFGPKERVETLSVGDRIGWQIIPAGRRLFIRPQEEGGHTNMTVITNLHTYQFDLVSDQGGALRPDEALVYVVRFYYPEDDLHQRGAAYASDIPIPSGAPGQSAGAPAQMAPETTQANPGFNYRYTYAGDDAIAPRKVYDDGQSTYFELPAKPLSASMIGPDGREVPVRLEDAGGSTVRAPLVARRFVFRYAQPPAGAAAGAGSGMICIYNEAF